MSQFFFLQITANGIPYYIHLIIITAIMISSGLLGGFAGFLMERNQLIHTAATLEQEINLKRKKYIF